MPEAAQHKAELAIFLDLIYAMRVRSYLEIGVRHGGSMAAVAGAIEPDARILGIDLPDGLWGVSRAATQPQLDEALAAMRDRGQDAQMIYGNSRDPEVIEVAREAAPFDLMFVDGDHTLEGVTADWENYGQLARVVAFHDIDSARSPKPSARRVGVRPLWEKLKAKHDHVEIVGAPGGWGIGMLWRYGR